MERTSRIADDPVRLATTDATERPRQLSTTAECWPRDFDEMLERPSISASGKIPARIPHRAAPR